jgi:hypothetical protein
MDRLIMALASGAPHVIRAVWTQPRKKLRDDPASVLFRTSPASAEAQTAGAGSNSIPSSQMRCKMTASLRATAVLARREPIFALSFSPQVRSELLCRTRVINALAASNRQAARGTVPGLGDPPGQVDLARLVASWCQPEKGPDIV